MGCMMMRGPVVATFGLAVALALTGPARDAVAQGASAPLPPAAPPVFQPVTADRIAAALRLDALAEVLAAEVAVSGDPLGSATRLPAAPDPVADEGWARIVARIAPAGRIGRGLRDGVAAELSALADPADRAALAGALAFWETPLGRRTLDLEHSARRALTEPGAETAARAAFDRAAAQGAPRVDQIRRLIEAGDLVEPAVASSLNIALASMQGIRDAGAFDADDADLAADVWLQEPEIRAEQAGWLEALLFLATGPLDDAEVEALIVQAETPGARRLNRIVDAAATAVFAAIAHDLGKASAQRLAGQKL